MHPALDMSRDVQGNEERLKMDWLNSAEGWLDQHIEDTVEAGHVCDHSCHGETYAAALIVIGQELQKIRQLLEEKPK